MQRGMAELQQAAGQVFSSWLPPYRALFLLEARSTVLALISPWHEAVTVKKTQPEKEARKKPVACFLPSRSSRRTGRRRARGCGADLRVLEKGLPGSVPDPLRSGLQRLLGENVSGSIIRNRGSCVPGPPSAPPALHSPPPRPLRPGARRGRSRAVGQGLPRLQENLESQGLRLERRGRERALTPPLGGPAASGPVGAGERLCPAGSRAQQHGGANRRLLPLLRCPA